MTASYAVSVRQANGLLAASFGSHLAVDTLAVRLTVPAAGPVGDFHPRVSAPCRAHTEKWGADERRPVAGFDLHEAQGRGGLGAEEAACPEDLATHVIEVPERQGDRFAGQLAQ